MQCIRDVVGKAVKDSEVKGAWDETKATLDNLVNVEWKDCSENEDIAEQAQLVFICTFLFQRLFFTQPLEFSVLTDFIRFHSIQ